MKKERPSTEDKPTPHWKAVEQALDQHRGKRRQVRRALSRPGGRPGRELTVTELPVLFVTDTIARRTLQLLEPSKKTDIPAPGAVYWFGFAQGDQACATTLLIPEEDKRADSVLASAVANEEVFSAIISASLVFLAHVRLDAGDETDQLVDVRFDGAFILQVRPGTAPSEFFDPQCCRVHRQVEGSCRAIAAGDVHQHLRLIPGFKDLRDRPRR